MTENQKQRIINFFTPILGLVWFIGGCIYLGSIK